MSKEKRFTYSLKEATLFAAITKSNTYQAIELMKQEGINLNAKNCKGETFLHCAVSRQDQEVVKALIDAGVNLNICDNNGWTPIYLSIASGNIDIIKLLIDANAQLDIRDQQGNTPVQYAFQYQQQEAFALLLARHINFNVSLGHTSAELIESYSTFKSALCYEDEELSNDISQMLSTLPFDDIPYQENVINPGIAEGGPNIEERKLEQEEIGEGDKYIALISLQGIEGEENKGGDNNPVHHILQQSSHQGSNTKLEEYDLFSGGAGYPTTSADNKKSNWAAFKNFFSSLVSTLSIKVLGLYIPAMPTDSSAEKSAYSASPNQNKQKWWEKGGNSWVASSGQFKSSAMLGHFSKPSYFKSLTIKGVDSLAVEEINSDEHMTELGDGLKQDV